jgi:hypothetical protein
MVTSAADSNSRIGVKTTEKGGHAPPGPFLLDTIQFVSETFTGFH